MIKKYIFLFVFVVATLAAVYGIITSRNNTNDFVTYIDQEHGFKFEHPTTYTKYETVDSSGDYKLIYFINPSEYSKDSENKLIKCDQYPSGYFSYIIEDNFLNSLDSDLKIDGRPAKRSIQGVTILNDDEMILLYTCNDNEEFDQILSSLEFIE